MRNDAYRMFYIGISYTSSVRTQGIHLVRLILRVQPKNITTLQTFLSKTIHAKTRSLVNGHMANTIESILLHCVNTSVVRSYDVRLSHESFVLLIRFIPLRISRIAQYYVHFSRY